MSAPSTTTYPTLHNLPEYKKGINGQACLFLHGLGGGCYEQKPLLNYLHQTGYSVRDFLYPGHRGKHFWMPMSTWQDWYIAAQQEYQELKSRYDKVFVIGLSTGATVATHLALEHASTQPVDKLVLLAPFFGIKSQGWQVLPLEWHAHWVVPLVRHLKRGATPTRDPIYRKVGTALAYSKTFNLHTVKSALELINLLKPRLNALNTPTLVVQSPLDTVVCPQASRLAFEAIGGEGKKLLWLKKSNHILPLDVERERVFQCVQAFLDKFTKK